jgi:RNA polymerase sigma-70 factor (ECF subfamily)
VHVAEYVYERFIEGDMEAVSVLVEAYRNELYNFCFRLTFNTHDAEDLFQQTWIKAVRGAPRYRHGDFRPWLYRICVNQYRDNWRKMQNRKKHVAEAFPTTSAKDYVLESTGGESAEETFEKRHIQSLLVANIDRLPEKQKVPVVMYFYQRMKLAEIAAALCVPEGTVKSRIAAAKKKLKEQLGSELYV